jgi:hypothetical protein
MSFACSPGRRVLDVDVPADTTDSADSTAAFFECSRAQSCRARRKVRTFLAGLLRGIRVADGAPGLCLCRDQDQSLPVDLLTKREPTPDQSSPEDHQPRDDRYDSSLAADKDADLHPDELDPAFQELENILKNTVTTDNNCSQEDKSVGTDKPYVSSTVETEENTVKGESGDPLEAFSSHGDSSSCINMETSNIKTENAEIASIQRVTEHNVSTPSSSSAWVPSLDTKIKMFTAARMKDPIEQWEEESEKEFTSESFPGMAFITNEDAIQAMQVSRRHKTLIDNLLLDALEKTLELTGNDAEEDFQ